LRAAPTVSRSTRAIALGYGLATHTLFLAGVGSMIVGIASGMRTGRGTLHGGTAWLANTALVLQFPLLHTPFLSTRGRALLGHCAPPALRRDLGTTLYAAFAALQLLATFVLWSPSGTVWFQPHGALAGVSLTLYASAWLMVAKSMSDASFALQTGALGWWALFRGRRPNYPPMPTRGLFAHWRQPIYTSFAATLLSGPVWTPDRALLVLVWGLYCVIGPRFKEQRFLRFHGAAFEEYRARHPYWLPRLRARRGVERG
jgi:protein-S-isoprenylcysteine O-methyltransferase Ste14